MDKRGRIPGPIDKKLAVGNLGQLVGPTTSPWISLDPTSPGWAFNDPNSAGTLTSISVSDNGIRFVLDKAREEDRWNAADQHGGRYYKQLHADSGPLTWSKIFSIELLFWRTAVHTNSNSGQQDDSGVVVGIADSSCIAGTTNVNWIGLGSYSQKSKTQRCTGQLGGNDPGLQEISTDTAIRRFYVSIGPAIDDGGTPDGNPKVHRALAYGLDDNNRLIRSVICSPQVHQYSGSDPVYLFLAPCFRSNKAASLSDHPDFEYKLWYKISEDPELMLPQYVQNQG